MSAVRSPHRESTPYLPVRLRVPLIPASLVVPSFPALGPVRVSHRTLTPEAPPTTQSSEADPAANLIEADDYVFRFSLGPQHEATAVMTATVPVTATLASVATVADSSAATRRPFEKKNASAFPAKLSATELRTVLRVLSIKSRMQSDMAKKRAIAASSMEEQDIYDENLEALIDEADMAPSSTPAFGSWPSVDVSASDLTRAGSSGRSGAGATSALADSPAVAAGRGPAFSSSDMARLAHVVTDPHLFDIEAVRFDSQPLSRAELEKLRDGLWDGVLAPAFNNSDCKPAQATPMDGVLESDLHGFDPSRITSTREASELDNLYCALRSDYNKAYSNYTRSGQMEGAIVKDYVNGDYPLLYLHCLLFDNPSVDFVLRSLPQAAQAEVGLPVSAAVGRGPGHPGSAPLPIRKRTRQAEVVIGGIENLTAAIVEMGVPNGADDRDSTGHTAATAFENAEAMGAVWKQLKAARDAIAEEPGDVIAISMRNHFEQQLENLMGTE